MNSIILEGEFFIYTIICVLRKKCRKSDNNLHRMQSVRLQRLSWTILIGKVPKENATQCYGTLKCG